MSLGTKSFWSILYKVSLETEKSIAYSEQCNKVFILSLRGLKYKFPKGPQCRGLNPGLNKNQLWEEAVFNLANMKPTPVPGTKIEKAPFSFITNRTVSQETR